MSSARRGPPISVDSTIIAAVRPSFASSASMCRMTDRSRHSPLLVTSLVTWVKR